MKPNRSSPFYRFVSWLHLLEVKTIFPLVLYLWCDAGLSEDEALQCFEDLLSYLVRRFVCRRETRSYSSEFMALIRDLRTVGDAGELASRAKLQRLLLRSTNHANDWPTDLEFEQAWLTVNAYEALHAPRVEAILLAIEGERQVQIQRECLGTVKAVD